MKEFNMSEPASSTAASIGLYKLAAAAGGSGALIAVINMALNPPRSKKELAAMLAATLAFSLGLGSALVMWIGVSNWINQGAIGIAGIGGILFSVGSIGWLLIRKIFDWFNKDKDLIELVKEVKDAVKK